jgi:hypothetical protein
MHYAISLGPPVDMNGVKWQAKVSFSPSTGVTTRSKWVDFNREENIDAEIFYQLDTRVWRPRWEGPPPGIPGTHWRPLAPDDNTIYGLRIDRINNEMHWLSNGRRKLSVRRLSVDASTTAPAKLFGEEPAGSSSTA